MTALSVAGPLEPATQAFIDSLAGGTPIYTLSPEAARNGKLAAAGVTVTSVRYNGTIHDFMLLNPIGNTPAVRGAVDQALSYLRKVFADR
jgi:acetyl esterase/lipase